MRRRGSEHLGWVPDAPQRGPAAPIRVPCPHPMMGAHPPLSPPGPLTSSKPEQQERSVEWSWPARSYLPIGVGAASELAQLTGSRWELCPLLEASGWAWPGSVPPLGPRAAPCPLCPRPSNPGALLDQEGGLFTPRVHPQPPPQMDRGRLVGGPAPGQAARDTVGPGWGCLAHTPHWGGLEESETHGQAAQCHAASPQALTHSHQRADPDSRDLPGAAPSTRTITAGDAHLRPHHPARLTGYPGLEAPACTSQAGSCSQASVPFTLNL